MVLAAGELCSRSSLVEASTPPVLAAPELSHGIRPELLTKLQECREMIKSRKI